MIKKTLFFYIMQFLLNTVNSKRPFSYLEPTTLVTDNLSKKFQKKKTLIWLTVIKNSFRL